MLPHHLSRDYSTKPANSTLLPSEKSAFQMAVLFSDLYFKLKKKKTESILNVSVDFMKSTNYKKLLKTFKTL